ncbi:MAG: potassium efflux system protein [Dokdonia sp.]|jgi:small-conductance mechanosensitive channel
MKKLEGYISKWFLFCALASVSIVAKPQGGLLDSAQVQVPIAITNTDLSGKMLLVKEQLKSANLKLEPNTYVLKMDSLIPVYSGFLTAQKKGFTNFKKSHPNKQKVINLVNKWGSYSAFLGTWQSSINKFIDKNAIWLDQLSLMEKEWSLTYAAALSQKAPPEVSKNIRLTRNQVSNIRERVTKQNNEFLKQEVRILILKERINSVIEELEIWKKSDEFAVFKQRHPSVWNLASVQKEKNQVDHFDSWASFIGNIVGTWSYLQSPENNILSFTIVLLLLSLWFWRLRKSFKEIPVDYKDKALLQAKLLILNHLTPSVIFAFTVLSMVYLSHTPNLLGEILLLIALLATIPLLKSDTHEKFKGFIYFIILLFLLNTVKSYIWYSAIVYRAYLAMEALVALAILAKFIYPFYKTKQIELSKNSRVILFISPSLYIIFAGSLVANIFGYTNFTDLLLKIGIEGSVLLLLLTSMLAILGGLTTGTVYFYVSKLEIFDSNYSFYLQKRAMQVVVVFAYVFMLVYFLHIIDVHDLVLIWLEEKFTEPVVWANISFTLGSIISFFAILIGSFVVTSFISKSIDGGVLNFMKLAKGVPSIISVVIRYFLIAFAFVVAMSTIGIDLGKFNLMAGALGLGIGFGLQNIISNFVSGLILIFERPVQTSDVVEVGSLMGRVTKIGVRSSNVRTFDGAEVVVPNSNLISKEVINWTLSDNVKRMEIHIGAAYGTDLEKVIKILKKEAVLHPVVLKSPEPSALFDKFGDSSLDFRLRFWVPVEFALETKSDISISVYNSFTAAGINIPFPQRDVHIASNVSLENPEDE